MIKYKRLNSSKATDAIIFQMTSQISNAYFGNHDFTQDNAVVLQECALYIDLLAL